MCSYPIYFMNVLNIGISVHCGLYILFYETVKTETIRLMTVLYNLNIPIFILFCQLAISWIILFWLERN